MMEKNTFKSIYETYANLFFNDLNKKTSIAQRHNRSYQSTDNIASLIAFFDFFYYTRL
jgi:hypothetical protein